MTQIERPAPHQDLRVEQRHPDEAGLEIELRAQGHGRNREALSSPLARRPKDSPEKVPEIRDFPGLYLDAFLFEAIDERADMRRADGQRTKGLRNAIERDTFASVDERLSETHCDDFGGLSLGIEVRHVGSSVTGWEKKHQPSPGGCRGRPIQKRERLYFSSSSEARQLLRAGSRFLG